MIKTLLILILQIAILIAVLIGLGLVVAKLADVVAYFYLKGRAKKQGLDFQVVWANYKKARAKEKNLIKGDYELASHPHEKRSGKKDTSVGATCSPKSSKQKISSRTISKLSTFLFVSPRVRRAQAAELAKTAEVAQVENNSKESSSIEEEKISNPNISCISNSISDSDKALETDTESSKKPKKPKKPHTFFGQYSAQRHALRSTYSILKNSVKNNTNSQDK